MLPHTIKIKVKMNLKEMAVPARYQNCSCFNKNKIFVHIGYRFLNNRSIVGNEKEA